MAPAQHVTDRCNGGGPIFGTVARPQTLRNISLSTVLGPRMRSQNRDHKSAWYGRVLEATVITALACMSNWCLLLHGPFANTSEYGNGTPGSHEGWGSHLSSGGAGLPGGSKPLPKVSEKFPHFFNILIVRHVNQIFGNALVLTSKHESSRSFRKLPKALSYFLNGFASRLGPVHFSDTRTFEKYSESPFGPMQSKVLLNSLFSSSWHSKCFFFTTVRLA